MAGTSGNILTIDQGTTNTKVLLVDPGGMVVAEASRPLTQRYPQPAWVEQDAAAIWRSSSAVASPLGAAYLAGLAVGTWSTLKEIAQLARPREPFERRIAEQERAWLYAGWQRAVARATRGTAEPR